MEMVKNLPYYSFLVLLALVWMFVTCAAQNSPGDFLAAHNAARAQVGVGPMVWDERVATFARNYVNSRLGDCSLIHSSNRPYGENLAAGSGDFTGVAAVNLWVNERRNYSPAQNACVGGECLHYTQVVWRNSVRLGCHRAQCRNGWWFVSCNYDPPGNYIGQRPY